jgi:hypothetical protein
MRIRSRTALGLSAAVLCSLVAGAAGTAASVRPTPLARAARRASTVVVGTAAASSCRLAATPSGRVRIFTDTEFRDLRVVSGTVNTRNLVLSVVGGTLGDRTLHVAGAPAFEAGVRYVLFLDDAEPLCGLAGWTQGMFRVVPLPDGGEGVLDAQGVPVAAVSDGRTVAGTDPIRLEPFLAAVGELARTGPGPREPRAEGARIEEGGR